MARKKKRVNRVRGDTIEVDNPAYKPGHHGQKWNPQKIRSGFNQYEDPASTMYARRKLSESQFAAAYKFREYYERGGGKGAGAINYENPEVDGGASYDPMNDRQMDAHKALKDAHNCVGTTYYKLLEMFCGQRFSVKQITHIEYGRATRMLQRGIQTEIKTGLSQLANLWGLSFRV